MTIQTGQYVGIAATMSVGEVGLLKDILDEVGWPEHVGFMNGPLVSRKTLAGQPASNPGLYPPIGNIAGLMVGEPRFFNVVHFNSRDPRLSSQLGRIVDLSPNIHGIQLNILWPDRAELAEFRRQFPGIKIILQISRFCLESVGGNHASLVECLGNYEGLADYGLFDPSGGEGRPYDQAQAAELLGCLVDSGLLIHWGVTGGLCADRILGLRSLLDIYPTLCWDAQSGLRDSQDALDAGKCFGFLAASAAMLKTISS